MNIPRMIKILTVYYSTVPVLCVSDIAWDAIVAFGLCIDDGWRVADEVVYNLTGGAEK